MTENKNLFNSLFTLFHHNIYFKENTFDFDADAILKNTLSENKGIEDIAKVLSDIVILNTKGLTDKQISITLTGGMDSRLILACLLNAGFKPNCLTFGNPKSRDVIFAKKLAENLGLPYHNVCSTSPDKDWYYKWVTETIKRDNGHAHFHRAHRTAAMAEHAEKFNPSVLFTGHMGGEGLRGLTYNNYFSSYFFEQVNEGKVNPHESAKIILHDYFLRPENINHQELFKEIDQLDWMKHDKQTNKYFYLYNLVAKIHHAQDIRLYQSYIPKVVPVFLQNDYLKILFASPFNFMSKQKKALSRLRNPEIYCKLIKILYPPLLDFKYANGFTPRQYLKGLWYYVPVKLYYDLTKKKKFSPTFSYGKWYVDFVKEHAQNINLEIWEIYDKKRYWEALENNTHKTDEGYWHKFSNPIYFDLIEKHKKGLL